MTRFQTLPATALLILFAVVVAVAQKPELVVQTGHAAGVHTVAVSRDGRTFASGSFDGTIKLRDMTNGRELRTLSADFALGVWMHALAFDYNGRLIAGGTADGRVKLWDVETGALKGVLQPRVAGETQCEVGVLAFSPDGRTLAASCNLEFVILDIATEKVVHILRGHRERLSSVVFSPDGEVLATAAWDGAVKLWSTKTGSLLRTITASASAPASAVAFRPDGLALASASHDGAVKLWDAATGRLVRTLARPLPALPDGSDNPKSVLANAVTFSPDGRAVAAGFSGGEVKVWDAPAGSLRATFKPGAFGFDSVAFAPDGLTLVGGDEAGGVYVWDVATGALRFPRAGVVALVSALAVSADGRMLASGHEEATGDGVMNRVRLWSFADGRELRVLPESPGSIKTLAFSPDNRTLAVGASDCEHGDSAVELWDVAAGTRTRSLKEHRCEVYRVAFSPDGRTLLTVGNDAGYNDSPSYSVRQWDTATGRELSKFAAPQDARSGLTKIFLERDSLAFSPDRKLIAGQGNNEADGIKGGGSLFLWDFAGGQEPRELTRSEESYSAVSFSPDGRTLAAATRTKADGYAVGLWDVASGRQLRLFSKYEDEIQTLAFSPDGRTLVGSTYSFSGHQGRMIFWDTAAGKELLKTDEGANIFSFMPDGRMLVCLKSSDHSLILRDTASGRKLAGLVAVNDDDWLVAAPDGLFDGTPAAWGKLMWRFSPSLFDIYPVEAFFNEFYHPGLLPELLSGQRPEAAQDISRRDRRQPQVVITQSPVREETGAAARTIALRVGVKEAGADKEHPAGGGVQDVRLFRNGALVKVWHADVLGGRAQATLEATVPIVAGENVFTAYAFNRDNVKSADATLDVEGADALRRPGRSYILAVGINGYANAQYDLKYAVADADEFGRELQRRQESLKTYERVEVVLLHDAEATKANILGALKRLAERVRPEDTLTVYFAGHGTAHENRFYLIPHDLGYAGAREELSEEGLRSIIAHAVSDRELEEAFEGIDAGQLMLVIDACNSGQALEAEEKRRGPMNSKGLAQLAYEKGMYVLTAAQSFQAAQEAARLGHGYLTFALVEEGLKTGAADGEPKDGVLLVREWLDYATGRVPQMQLESMKDAGRRGLKLAFVGGEEKIADPSQRSVQRPRVFYRRELNAKPLVISRTTADAAPSP
ncbi:MAG: hypothetical protein QOJ76_2054 [Acidobacteriota bacterium]|nr:hypothetical protein [Acidobacteriota bacterium]